MSVFIKIKDQQLGPYSYNELKKLVTEGSFDQDDLVFSEASNEWVRAGHLEELRKLFPGPVSTPSERMVYAIGGGKGGVGKTVLTASIGIGLAALGYRVVMVDADLGGANLHTCMGILEPQYTFYHFYSLQKESLSDILLDTPIENLKLISGACGTLGLANPRYSQKLRFINELRKIDADFILLDLGAGSSYNVIDFFLAADHGLAVTTPEPMAIQETFNFLKIALMRKLTREFKDDPDAINRLEQEVFADSGRMSQSVGAALQKLAGEDPATAKRIQGILDGFTPSLILNMVHSEDEVKEGVALRTAVEELLAMKMNFLGYVEHDESVRRAVKELRPFVVDDPTSRAAKNLAKLITVGLLKKTGWAGFKEKRRVLRQVKQQNKEYPSQQIRESETICSVQCFYWGDCEYQNGGYPCPVRHLDPIFKS
ncbi:MAG TPA: P-loop NTPase [bacterium]|nr:P-loop NTPase [bacterium]HPG82645.1 P-loop NTPase [bacterium]HPM58589.1 P-loop NTPase [bacterium]